MTPSRLHQSLILPLIFSVANVYAYTSMGCDTDPNGFFKDLAGFLGAVDVASGTVRFPDPESPSERSERPPPSRTEEDPYYTTLHDDIAGPTGTDGVLYSLFPNVFVTETVETRGLCASSGPHEIVVESFRAYARDAGYLADDLGSLRCSILTKVSDMDDVEGVPIGVASASPLRSTFRDPRRFVRRGEWEPYANEISDETSLLWFPPWLQPTLSAEDDNEFVVFTVPAPPTGWWPKGRQALRFEPTDALKECSPRRCVEHAFPAYMLITNSHGTTLDKGVTDLADAVTTVWDANPPSEAFSRKWGAPKMTHRDAFYYYVTRGSGWNEIQSIQPTLFKALATRVKALAKIFLRRTETDVDEVLLRANSMLLMKTSIWGAVTPLDGDSYLRTHVHPISKVVGTFYAQPQCDADFLILDPRQGWMDRFNAIELRPTPGMATNFVPWLPHQVKQVSCDNKLRVIFAANWEQRGRFERKHPWAYTACGRRDCKLREPYEFATSVSKRVLWDEPLREIQRKCRDEATEKSEL